MPILLQPEKPKKLGSLSSHGPISPKREVASLALAQVAVAIKVVVLLVVLVLVLVIVARTIKFFYLHQNLKFWLKRNKILMLVQDIDSIKKRIKNSQMQLIRLALTL